MEQRENIEYWWRSNKNNITSNDLLLIFDDEISAKNKKYKKDVAYLIKLYNNHKADDVLDSHTSGIKRFHLFLDKKDNEYLTEILEFIDTTIDWALLPLVQIPKNHIDDYIKKYEECCAKQDLYENMKQEIIKYYEVRQ